MSFANLKIGTRLMAGFGVVIALTLIMGVVSLLRLGAVYQEWNSYEAVTLVKADAARHGHLALGDGIHLFKNYILRGGEYDQKFEGAMKAIEKAAAEYRAAGALSTEDEEALKEIAQGVAAYRTAVHKAVEMRGAGSSVTDIDKGISGADKALGAAFVKLARSAEDTTKVQSKNVTSVVTGARYTIALVAAFVVLLALGLAFVISRSITRPLSRAVDVAHAMAQGDINGEIEATGKDETAQLLQAMKGMVGTFKGFAAAQQYMAKQHDAGALDEKIAAEKFPGVYGQMAQSINELAQSHIDVTMKVVAVVKRYAQGDLSVDMDKLPGKKAQITEAIDGVKASLKAVNAQIGQLVDAAARGDFKVRGNVDQYQHDFRKMVEGLNTLMQLSDTALNEVVRVLGALARGDLTEKIANEYKGTFGQLKDDANTTVEKLTEIVGQIKEATESINVASREIASGNADLSSRTEEQASSLEETASSMEELTSTVKQNAENARQANQLAAGASEIALKGGNVVGQVVTTMSSINESSKKIVDIIAVIDGIAFQTNILALNAAVEAARAGEQGRGFAVVASEVRNLAQRSAAAAKEIKELITDSVGKVQSGTQLVDEAGKTMEEIVTSVKRVTDIMAEITAASQEQSGGIEQVNTAITQMDQVTQQNAALVEEAAAAAESLEEQAKNLAQSVATFKLAQGAGVVHQAVERRAPERAKNVSRLPAAKTGEAAAKPAVPAKASKTKVAAAGGGAQEWKEF